MKTRVGPDVGPNGPDIGPEIQSEVGSAGLEKFYSAMWSDRWPALSRALRTEAFKCRIENPFVGVGNSLRPYYELDPASVLVAQLVGACADEDVLDMCASPGGKSLMQIFEHGSATGSASATSAAEVGRVRWWLNDISNDRVFRLKKVLADHLPDKIFQPIKITSFDANQFGIRKPGFFDRILLDAPCSGERHVYENEKALAEWSPSRSSGLVRRQYSLFCSAELALKPGGRLVYSTCTISHPENDGVIARYFEKHEKKVAIGKVASGALKVWPEEKIRMLVDAWLKKNELEIEPTEFGFYILPDRSNGAGPMFFSVLEKPQSI